MKTLDWYRKLENKTADCLLGDIGEALWHVNEASFVVVPLSGDSPASVITKDAWVKTVHSNDYAFCMTGVDPNQHRTFAFTQKQKDKIVGFGDAALLFTDVYELFNRVKRKVNALGYMVTHKFVQYYDESEDDVSRSISMMPDMRNIAFYKRERYAFQQEYRILVTPNIKIKEDFIKLEIGDIRDISVVYKTEQMLESRIKEGNPNDQT